MPARALTGSRIRERRLTMGLRQSALAQTVGISAAYLNLIEHNRRRIGGKLLLDLAQQLGVEAAALSEGAEAALVEALRNASAGRPEVGVEAERIEDLAGRYPGWAELIAAQHRRILGLEQITEALTDRLTHDPQLAASMHEVLSVVTAIRSTSAILAGTDAVDADWQARFHRNLYEDSQRLAESSQALVEYLDAAGDRDGDAETGLTLPQEELETWLEGRDFHIAELERALPASPETVLGGATGLRGSPAAMLLAGGYLKRYRRDAEAMPLASFRSALREAGPDPAALAARFGCDLAAVLRRIAAVPDPDRAGPVGLVECDGSGTLTYRKSIDGFALPRFGAACPLWPLYQALARPMAPLRQLVEQSGLRPLRFLTYAISQPVAAAAFDRPPVFRATMLILPDTAESSDDRAALPIGSSCRICPRSGCDARREPSILTEGF